MYRKFVFFFSWKIRVENVNFLYTYGWPPRDVFVYKTSLRKKCSKHKHNKQRAKKKNCENENQQQLFTIPALISKTKTMCKTSLTSQTPRPSSSFTIFNTSAHQTNGKKTHNRTKKKIAKHTKLSLHFNCVAFCCRFYCHFFSLSSVVMLFCQLMHACFQN